MEADQRCVGRHAGRLQHALSPRFQQLLHARLQFPQVVDELRAPPKQRMAVGADVEQRRFPRLLQARSVSPNDGGADSARTGTARLNAKSSCSFSNSV